MTAQISLALFLDNTELMSSDYFGDCSMRFLTWSSHCIRLLFHLFRRMDNKLKARFSNPLKMYLFVGH